MKNYHLTQINIAKMLAPIDSPVMEGFVANLGRINEIAEKSTGFIWRLKDENDNATSIKVFDDDFLIVNMSVWESKKALFDFTYGPAHVEIFKRRKEWFHKMSDMHMALWYVEEGHDPLPEEAKERLSLLNELGETPFAFTFKSDFDSKDALNYQSKL